MFTSPSVSVSRPYDCPVIGSGPAGITTALELAKANRKVLVFESGTAAEARTDMLNAFNAGHFRDDWWDKHSISPCRQARLQRSSAGGQPTIPWWSTCPGRMASRSTTTGLCRGDGDLKILGADAPLERAPAGWRGHPGPCRALAVHPLRWVGRHRCGQASSGGQGDTAVIELVTDRCCCRSSPTEAARSPPCRRCPPRGEAGRRR
ncbi:MAG: NAD(P)-binding protein [Acidobacteria bacterium]|nr:NAD(P)-binding protein [Acidobacteriota bacterium]